MRFFLLILIPSVLIESLILVFSSHKFAGLQRRHREFFFEIISLNEPKNLNVLPSILIIKEYPIFSDYLKHNLTSERAASLIQAFFFTEHQELFFPMKMLARSGILRHEIGEFVKEYKPKKIHYSKAVHNLLKSEAKRIFELMRERPQIMGTYFTKELEEFFGNCEDFEFMMNRYFSPTEDGILKISKVLNIRLIIIGSIEAIRSKNGSPHLIGKFLDFRHPVDYSISALTQMRDADWFPHYMEVSKYIKSILKEEPVKLAIFSSKLLLAIFTGRGGASYLPKNEISHLIYAVQGFFTEIKIQNIPPCYLEDIVLTIIGHPDIILLDPPDQMDILANLYPDSPRFWGDNTNLYIQHWRNCFYTSDFAILRGGTFNYPTYIDSIEELLDCWGVKQNMRIYELPLGGSLLFGVTIRGVECLDMICLLDQANKLVFFDSEEFIIVDDECYFPKASNQPESFWVFTAKLFSLNLIHTGKFGIKLSEATIVGLANGFDEEIESPLQIVSSTLQVLCLFDYIPIKFLINL